MKSNYLDLKKIIVLGSIGVACFTYYAINKNIEGRSSKTSKVCVFGKRIQFTNIPEIIKENDREADWGSKACFQIRQTAIQQVIRNISFPDPTVLELWCRGYLLQVGLSDTDLIRAVKAVKLERELIEEVLKRDFSTIPTTQSTSLAGRFSQDSEMTYDEALQSIRKRFPTKSSMEERLEELDRLPAVVSLFGDTGEWQLRLTKFVEGKYGTNAIDVKDENVVRVFSNLGEDVLSKKQNIRALKVFIETNYAIEIFEKYLLEEMQKGVGITFEDSKIKKVIIEAQKRRVESIHANQGHLP